LILKPSVDPRRYRCFKQGIWRSRRSIKVRRRVIFLDFVENDLWVLWNETTFSKGGENRVLLKRLLSNAVDSSEKFELVEMSNPVLGACTFEMAMF
jgi:hypothetical protein